MLTDRDNEVINFYRNGIYGIVNYEQSMNDMAMYTGKLTKEGQEYFLLLIVGKASNGTNIQYSYEIIKSGELEVMPLTKASMASDIANKGKTILTGLYFDHNKSTLKKE